MVNIKKNLMTYLNEFWMRGKMKISVMMVKFLFFVYFEKNHK